MRSNTKSLEDHASGLLAWSSYNSMAKLATSVLFITDSKNNNSSAQIEGALALVDGIKSFMLLFM